MTTNINNSQTHLPITYTVMVNTINASIIVSTIAETKSGNQLEEALNILSDTADQLARTSEHHPHYYCQLSDESAPDKVTMQDDLLRLASQVQSCAQIVRNCLGNEQHVARYAQTLDGPQEARRRLTEKCEQLESNARFMIETAEAIAIQIKEECAPITAQLEAETSLPTAVLAIIAQYSVT